MSLFSKIIMMLTITIMTLGCAKITHISTNLDKDNFVDYFSPNQVEIVESEQAFSGQYKYLGLVEGEACQAKSHHAHPDKIDARTDARRKAYKLGANAIIFSQCVDIENNQADKGCVATKVCYGRAFFVKKKAN